MREEDFLEGVEVDARALNLVQIVGVEELIQLTLRERNLFLHHDAVQKSLSRNMADAREVESIESVLCIRIHEFELLPQDVSDLSAQLLLFNAL